MSFPAWLTSVPTTWQALQLTVTVLALLVASYFLNLRNRWTMRKIPGPRPAFILGNLPEIRKLEVHNALHKWAKEYGTVFSCWFGRNSIVVISDPELIRQVAIKQFMTYHDRPKFLMQPSNPEEKAIAEAGIISARGKYWAGVRAACEPLFHSGPLASYIPVMDSAAKTLVGLLQKPAASGETLDVIPLLQGMTLEVIGTTAFGVHFESQGKEDPEIVTAAREFFVQRKEGRIWRQLVFALPVLAPQTMWLFRTLRNQALVGMSQARGFLVGTSQALLDNLRKTQKGENGHSVGPKKGSVRNVGFLEEVFYPLTETYFDSKARGRKAYRDAVPKDFSIYAGLLKYSGKDGSRLTDLQIHSQAQVFILAGYETTSTALSFALFELASLPEVTAKLLQEVDAFGRDRDPTSDDIPSFKYVEAVVYEAMRKYPPVTPLIIQREARTATELGGYRIPAGQRVWLNVYAVHHDPKYYPEPEVFRPERFFEDNTVDGPSTRPKEAYFPFGVGPHKCIGYKFAMEEAVLALVRLYQKYTFSLDRSKHPEGQPLELKASITLSAKEGLWLKVLPRH